MKNIKIITRADDAGSSKSANEAILQTIKAGFIKNVSLMAPGAFISEAATMFAGEKSICFGFHATLNAEWDKVKWKPLTDVGKNSGLTDDNGYFLAYPAMFKETKPKIEIIIKEYDAQLDKLTKLGFAIAYVDSHMFEEIFVEGLVDAKREWATRKGLINHMDYNNSPTDINKEENTKNLAQFLYSLPNGQYLYVVHPALYTDEMLETGHKGYPGSEVARGRALETRVVSDPELIKFAAENGIAAIRYDEAI